MSEYNTNEPETESCPSGDLQCVRCMELLILPTTFPCGHTTCRHCLATWIMQNNCLIECPVCKMQLKEFPNVNIALRNMIAEMHPSLLQKRQEMVKKDPVATGAFDRLYAIAQFNKDAELMQQMQQISQQPDPNLERLADMWKNLSVPFLIGAAYGFARVALNIVILVIYILMMITYPRESVTHKPMIKWTPSDVSQWIGELGPWATPLQEPLRENNTDGRTLFGLADQDLDLILDNLEPEYRDTFRATFHYVQNNGIKPPTNIWEYKDIHLKNLLTLEYGFFYVPRTTILVLYLFDYEDSFLPLIHASNDMMENISSLALYSDKLPYPTSMQMMRTFLQWILLPYSIVARFIWNSSILDTHPLLASIYIAACVIFTWTDFCGIRLQPKVVANVAQNAKNKGHIPAAYIVGHYASIALFIFVLGYLNVVTWYTVLPTFVSTWLLYSRMWVTTEWVFRTIWDTGYFSLYKSIRSYLH